MYQNNALKNDESRERPRAAANRATLRLFRSGGMRVTLLEQMGAATALLPKEERCRDSGPEEPGRRPSTTVSLGFGLLLASLGLAIVILASMGAILLMRGWIGAG
jgi:hypothetical protein